MDYDLGAWRGERNFVEVMITEQVCKSRQFGIYSGCSEKIEGEFGLWEKAIPLGEGKIFVTCRKSRHAVIFERADCSFCCVPSMHVRRGEFIKFVMLFQRAFEVGTAFVVEYKVFCWMTVFCETSVK